jgi:SNF2 family DNA or RNA helicase
MRTGKTAVILAEWAAAVTAGDLQSLLVVAPAGVYRVWEDQAREHLPPDLLARTTIHAWSAGANAAAKHELTRFLSIRTPRILLVNVEALSATVKEQRARTMAVNFLAQAPAMAVIDEATCIKGWQAQRARFVVRHLAPLAKRRRILSGLPAPQSPLDLYQQFAFLDPAILGHPTFASFRARYAIVVLERFGYSSRAVPIVKGYRDLKQIQHKIEPYSYRCRLEDCYDLPPKIYMRRDVDMTEEQNQVYSQIKKFATAKLSGEQHVTATMVLTQLLRLHQVLCGHTKSDIGQEVVISEIRTKAVLEILEDHPEPRKALVWATYDHDVWKLGRAIEEKFGKFTCAQFWGGNSAVREQEEKRFVSDPRCRFMVATPASGGKGRAWGVADLVVYYSNSYSLEHRLQSEERAQAVGKIKSVVYVDLICPGTVEEKILKSLRKKIDVSAQITGDDWREWVI